MRRVHVYLPTSALLIALALTVGCAKAPTDDQVATDIQNKLSADSGLQGKQLIVQAGKGTVTLSGTVDTDAQREAAARYAASEPGVKQVINNLQVASSGTNQTQTAQNVPPPAAAPAPQPDTKPSPSSKRRHESRMDANRSNNSDSSQSNSNNNQMASAAPPPVAESPAPVTPPPPPPPPPPQKLTIPSGAGIAVRLVDPLDSDTAQQGQVFHATLSSPLTVDGETAIPSGYDVEGHVATVQSAGKFAGQSMLVLQLDRIKVGDSYYNIQTDQFTRKASSRGKNTAEKVGGGAILGAIIGGIAGGGKGAAIGTAAGAGVGGGVQAAGHSQQVKLDSETALNFTLQAPVTVVKTTQGPDAGRPKLQSNQ
jgi:BON domain-containing protein